MTATFTAGQKLRATDLLQFPLGVVARNRRTTAISTTATTSAGGQRLMSTGGPVQAGRLYRVSFQGEIKNSGASVRTFVTIFYTTDGTAPDTADPILQQLNALSPVADAPVALYGMAFYVPASDHTFTVTPSLHGVSGTTTAEAGTAVPCELSIEDMGENVPISGIIY